MSMNIDHISSTNNFSLYEVQNLIDYIEENLLNTISLNQIASHFYLSKSLINGLFKMASGLTIMEYVRNRRLSLAGQDLLNTNLHIIDLAFKYGYETPEAFTKAFTRFYHFPPIYVRRTYPDLKMFLPLQIDFTIHGGWLEEPAMSTDHLRLTKADVHEQDVPIPDDYNKLIKSKGGPIMDQIKRYQLNLEDMKEKDSWNTLLHLVNQLKSNGITFKVDGNTMVFAHGLEFKLEKICLTLKIDEINKIQNFFGIKKELKQPYDGFQYFDTTYEGMLIRCMYYTDTTSSDTTLFNNTDIVSIGTEEFRVQSLEFFYENSTPDSRYYKMVEDYLQKQHN